MGNLLIEEYPLMVQPSLAKALGLNKALILQQIHYWLQSSRHIRDGRTWVYNTVEEWQVQFPFWATKTISRHINDLEKQGYLISTDRYNTNGFDKTKWYTIGYEKLEELAMQINDEKHRAVRAAIKESLGENVDVPSIGTNCPNGEYQGFAGVFSPQMAETDCCGSSAELPKKDLESQKQGWDKEIDTENDETEPDSGQNMTDPTETEPQGGDANVLSIGTNCPNEENQGLAPVSSILSGQNISSIRTDCPIRQDKLSCSIGTDCPIHRDNLSQPIPETNNRITQRTTTDNPAPVDNSRARAEMEPGLSDVVVPQAPSLDAPRESHAAIAEKLGIPDVLLCRLERKYGYSQVIGKIQLMEKALKKRRPIANPAGWLVMSLEQGYEDTEEAYALCREEARRERQQKSEALQEKMRKLLQQEAEAARKDLAAAPLAPEFAAVLDRIRAHKEKPAV